MKRLTARCLLLTALLLLLAATGCDNFDNDKLTEERAMHVFGTKGASKEPPDVCVPACTGTKVCIDGSCSDIGLKWVSIPGGTFNMGCSTGDGGCSSDEKPPHPVTVSSFKMLETEVTEGQYEAVMGDNPSCDYGAGGGADSPVECVDWNEAKAFCEAIGGRLPTEAEWEYSARGGTTTIYSCGDSSSCLGGIAWYESNSDGHKHDVKGKDPNGYGLYDMTGNVWEWVEDWYHDSYDGAPAQGYPAWTDPSGSARVSRGGGFDYGYFLRVSNRYFYSPSDDAGYLGCRCARSE